MKILISSSYGDGLNMLGLDADYDVATRRRLVKDVEAMAAGGDLSKYEGLKAVVKLPDNVYELQYGRYRDLVTIVNIDTSKLWAIHGYDGMEKVKYLAVGDNNHVKVVKTCG